jgi:hypothetical protein
LPDYECGNCKDQESSYGKIVISAILSFLVFALSLILTYRGLSFYMMMSYLKLSGFLPLGLSSMLFL